MYILAFCNSVLDQNNIDILISFQNGKKIIKMNLINNNL